MDLSARYIEMVRCPQHDLALGADGLCVLCRRASTPPAQRGRRRFVWSALALAAGASLLVAARLRPWEPPTATGRADPPKESAGTGRSGALTTSNSVGRTGAFYLPGGYPSTPLPLLVVLHGTGGTGAQAVNLFRGEAERRKFLVVGPDSRFSPEGLATWQAPTKAGETTEDREHIRLCVEEVRAMPGVQVQWGRGLIAGHSGGASTAPYVASVDELYEAFAVLHGGAFAEGLGPRRVRGWFSTGSHDGIRPPTGVRAAAAQVQGAGFRDVGYREFAEGHEVGGEEQRALVEWWLGERSD